jgi:hypothetical protein
VARAQQWSVWWGLAVAILAVPVTSVFLSTSLLVATLSLPIRRFYDLAVIIEKYIFKNEK